MTPTATGDGGRGRRWLAIAVVAAVLAVVGGGLAFFVLAGDGESERATELATITEDAVEFEPVDLADDVPVERRWTIEEGTLTSIATVTNDSDDDRWVVYDEVIPRAFRGDVELDRVDADVDGEVLDGADVVRFVTELGAGDSFDVTFEAELEAAPSLDELEAWTEEMVEAFEDHLDDDERSPRDGDVDGVVDGDDACPDDAGNLDGCPDADADGVADDADQCPEEVGDLDGCPDADADGVPDDADECPQDAGELDGCPDADGDGVVDDVDACPSDPGDIDGCPDTDADGVVDDLDPCPSEPGDVEGCPDTDADGVIDVDDRCPDDPGDVGGCPDGDGDGVADGADGCPAEPGEFDGCADNPAFFNQMYVIAIAQATEFDRVIMAYDPDGDGFTDDFARYCAEIRTNEQVSADNLQAALDLYRTEMAAETLAIAERTLVNVRNNVTLLGSCAAGGERGPWELDGSGWTTICALWNPLIVRSGDEPLTC